MFSHNPDLCATRGGMEQKVKIGSYHVDVGMIVAIALVIGASVALWVLNRRRKPDPENPIARAVMLARAAGLIAEREYYVADGSTEALPVTQMSGAEKKGPSAGWLVKLHNRKICVALVEVGIPLEDQRPQWRSWTKFVKE